MGNMKTLLVILILVLVILVVFSAMIYKMICVIEHLETKVDTVCGQIMEVYDEVESTLNTARENRMHLEDIIKDSNKKKNL